MNAQHYRALRLSVLAALLLASILLLAPWGPDPVSANAELLSLPNSCFAVPPAGPPTPPKQVAIARMEPPTTPPVDANWPIVEKRVKTVRDRSGTVYTITDITRRDPSGKRLANAPASSCTFDMSTTQERRTTVGGITQHLKNYFYRYRWSDPSHYVYAYWNYKTEAWWNRTDGSWGLGNSSIGWTFIGIDCSSVHRTYNAGSNLVPQWYNGGNETWHYFWDVTNSWVTLTSQVQSGDYLDTSAYTEYYQNGLKKGRILTEIVW